MIPKKPLSLFATVSFFAFCIPYAQGAESLQLKEAGYIDHQPATTSSIGFSKVSTSQHVVEINHLTETRLAVPFWLRSQDEAVYQRFINGALIYRPNPESDDGKIVLPISSLKNPLEDTFDLSQCGDMGKDLSIATGYRKEKKPENASKVEIWFAPRFLIEKELDTTAKHFQAIFSAKWNTSAPVGVFWTWGGWDNLSYMDYLTTENMDNLSRIDLYESWKKSRWVTLRVVLHEHMCPLRYAACSNRFHVSFETAT